MHSAPSRQSRKTPLALARTAWRIAGFLALLCYAAWRYARDVWKATDEDRNHARARWLHGACRRQLRLQNVSVTTRGQMPHGGLIVANHLTYLDIIALSAAMPCVFVSKKEIAAWPIFGLFGRLSGTLFLDRQTRGAVEGVAAQMRGVLAGDLPLVLFPEGTSTHGDTVLPFKTSLFEPVVALSCPVTAAAFHYALSDGSARDEVHWWGTITLAPHLLNLLSKRHIQVTITFGKTCPRSGDRKAIARELHDEVTTLLKAP